MQITIRKPFGKVVSVNNDSNLRDELISLKLRNRSITHLLEVAARIKTPINATEYSRHAKKVGIVIAY